MIYRLLFRLVLARIRPERAHALATFTLRSLTRSRMLHAVLCRLLAPRNERLRVHAMSLDFASPLGVAAGFDKDAKSYEAVAALGFGFVEVGTVTAHPQAGNPRPRVFRSIPDRAVVNSMGFPNPGAEVVAERLSRKTGDVVIGANIGKTKAVAMSEVGTDYRTSVELLARVSDYLVLNVSSPNTPGLRDMQATDRLTELVAAARSGLTEDTREVPLLVKIGPDLKDDEIDALADLAVELGLHGIVAVNTSIDLGLLSRSAEEVGVSGTAGVSGAPLKRRAFEVLQRLYGRVGDRLVLISVGGIEDAHDVWQRIQAGATLVQVHTGFVYGGPLWPRRVNRRLAKLAREAGFDSVQDAVGTGAQPSNGAALTPGEPTLSTPGSARPAVTGSAPVA